MTKHLQLQLDNKKITVEVVPPADYEDNTKDFEDSIDYLFDSNSED